MPRTSHFLTLRGNKQANKPRRWKKVVFCQRWWEDGDHGRVMFVKSIFFSALTQVISSLCSCLQPCVAVCTSVHAPILNTCQSVSSYQPRSKLSRGQSAAPSSPPCSGSAAGWCPRPWSASSLWTRPRPPAAARRPRTPWTGWSVHGCCTNSSGGPNKGC